ncbi:MAG TPA: CAP domain-containing protein, partial [Mycobacteriales bacterium]|nr:CAP domain-containing protein [Mycobacteriales bacterium]
NRHGRHPHGRHSARAARATGRPSRAQRRSRRATPVAAFLAVLVVALGAVWALGVRDGGTSQEAGLLAESTERVSTPSGRTGRPGAADAPAEGDHASRDRRLPPAPSLGTIAPGAPATSTAAVSTPSAPATHRQRTRTAAPSPSATAAAVAAAEAEVTRLTNVERTKAGCGALRVDPRLTAAAEAHSKDMVDRDYFSHTSPDGEGPGDRAEAAGYPRWSGENIAAGYPTPEAVVQGWMSSAGHRANILNCESKATGVGYDPRKDMWTQMFGYV